jgi:hypothetical protein
MESDKKFLVKCAIGAITSVVLVIALLMLLTQGPGGLRNTFTSWSANWAGHTRWLIVQYTVSGDVMNNWEIIGSIQHEKSGDGIYFTTDHGIIHLSGHFIYVQDPTDEARSLYLKKRGYR